MKNILRLSAAALLLSVGSFSTASAQASATATATATIVTPISISKTTDMNFGNVAVNATTAGTVEMTPAGSRTPTGGVTLPATQGTVAAASFDVSGQAGYTYAITLPTTTLAISNGSASMDVHSFTSSPSATGTLSSNGTDVVTVGATLDVDPAQAAGIYSSTTPFSVTVNYN
jgi:hypothetical protein